MTQRKHRTDEEWLALIRECRSSGLSDKRWCEEHQIHTSNFYYQIRRFRKMACEIPESQSVCALNKQEVVPISFDHTDAAMIQESDIRCPASQTTVRVRIHGFEVEITNAAAGETVFHTLSALQRLC